MLVKLISTNLTNSTPISPIVPKLFHHSSFVSLKPLFKSSVLSQETKTQVYNIASTQYAKEASNYIKILNELRRIGAQFAVKLPTIVFCGNQSAGKSSLLEAISGVKLPKSDGTCIRCVMELRLSEVPKTWSCQVSLRKEYGEHEKHLSHPIETKFGNPINDPHKVEITALRAQKAIKQS